MLRSPTYRHYLGYRQYCVADQALAESVARYSSTVRQAQDLSLGILGHDLRNPLGAIMMSSQLLLQNTLLDSRLIKPVSIIHNSGSQMGDLIDDLLDFTHARLGQVCRSPPGRWIWQISFGKQSWKLGDDYQTIADEMGEVRAKRLHRVEVRDTHGSPR